MPLSAITEMPMPADTENVSALWDTRLIKILLTDQTTKKFIIWASNDYAAYGDAYQATEQIYPSLLSGSYAKLIQTRVQKADHQKSDRTKNKAEVFTPAWICNAQNNLIDEKWFGKPDVFNQSVGTTWITQKGKITFPDDKNKTWQKYADAKRMEISCGEAPYLVSRYDVSTGAPIPLPDRIGLLDRKFRIISENTNAEEDWLFWAYRALESVYGYEYQGDNLLLARLNLFLSFLEYFRDSISRAPTFWEMRRAATIISWNLWQMDAFTCSPPVRPVPEEFIKTDIFYDTPDELIKPYTPPIPNATLCKIKDWRSKTILTYYSLLKGEKA